METTTGSCTQVYCKAPEKEDEVRFERKEVIFKKTFSQGRFRLAQEPKDEEVVKTLREIRDEQVR